MTTPEELSADRPPPGLFAQAAALLLALAAVALVALGAALELIVTELPGALVVAGSAVLALAGLAAGARGVWGLRRLWGLALAGLGANVLFLAIMALVLLVMLAGR